MLESKRKETVAKIIQTYKWHGLKLRVKSIRRKTCVSISKSDSEFQMYLVICFSQRKPGNANGKKLKPKFRLRKEYRREILSNPDNKGKRTFAENLLNTQKVNESFASRFLIFFCVHWIYFSIMRKELFRHLVFIHFGSFSFQQSRTVYRNSRGVHDTMHSAPNR